MKNESKKSFLFLLLAFTSFITMGQTKLADKLKAGQSEAEDATGEGLDIFLGYFDIVVLVFVIGWGVQAFRQSRANTDEDSGEGFSIIKFGSWRAGVILFYIVVRAALVPAFF